MILVRLPDTVFTDGNLGPEIGYRVIIMLPFNIVRSQAWQSLRFVAADPLLSQKAGYQNRLPP